MSHKFKFLIPNKESSNIWIVIISLLIFHFLYFYLHIHTTVVLDCMPYEEFWTWTDESGVGIFKIFILIFLLFAIWATLEMIVAHKRDLKDKKFCTISSILILIYIVYLMMSFKAHWESFEVKWGKRNYQDITFQFTPFPEISSQTPWDKFLDKRDCIDPRYYRNLKTPEDHDNYYDKLILEFFESGGTIKDIQQSHFKYIGMEDIYEQYRKQGVEVIIYDED